MIQQEYSDSQTAFISLARFKEALNPKPATPMIDITVGGRESFLPIEIYPENGELFVQFKESQKYPNEEIDITFIAAVLTIVGYSINDTIVTFDRIREHMRHEKVLTSKEQIYKVVDVSLRQTLTRSINTVLTVIITVVVMLLLGSSSIYSFNVALLIGLIFGLYSSLFIAAQLWAVLKVRELNKKGKIEVSVRQSPSERKENDKVLV